MTTLSSSNRQDPDPQSPPPSSSDPNDFQSLAERSSSTALSNFPRHQTLDAHPDSDGEENASEILSQTWNRHGTHSGHHTLPSRNDGGYRHLHIDWPNLSIKKTLTIGPSCLDASPPIYDRPSSDVERENAASCCLKTKGSPINAVVYVKKGHRDSGDKMLGKPILVSAKTLMGSIKLCIPSYSGSRPLHIRVKSHSGQIHLYLPPSFSGLLSWKSDSGTLKLSPTFSQRFKLLDDRTHKHRGTAKISPSVASGNRGDACEILTKSSNIHLWEAGEEEQSSSCVVS